MTKRSSGQRRGSRPDGRRPADLRPLDIELGYLRSALGSALVRAGNTWVLCTASVVEEVPRWLEESGQGWVTAEYDMLPASTGERRPRNRNRIDGRTQEIQRVIGRSLRAVVDLAALGPRTVIVDCDVLQADGGTRCASITGAFVALCHALARAREQGWISEWPVREPLGAVSAGRVAGRLLLDLCYEEDAAADVDFNVAMTASGELVEVQATGEGATFSPDVLADALTLARRGIRQIIARQKEALRPVRRWVRFVRPR